MGLEHGLGLGLGFGLGLGSGSGVGSGPGLGFGLGLGPGPGRAALLSVVNLGVLLGLRLVIVGEGAVLLLLRLDRPVVLQRAALHAHAVAVACDFEDGGRVGRSALPYPTHHRRAGRGRGRRHHVWRGVFVAPSCCDVLHLRRLDKDVVEGTLESRAALRCSRRLRWSWNRLVPRVVENAILHAVAVQLHRA